MEKYGCFLPKHPSHTLSSRPGRETTVLFWVPAEEELQSSPATLRNTVANVSQSLMVAPKEEGKWMFNGDFPVK